MKAKPLLPKSPGSDGVNPALSEVAHRALMRMLLEGELAPNEVVTERQIALKLGISRSPLREAVRRLEGQRFLEHNLKAEECYDFYATVRRSLRSEKGRKKAKV